MNNRLYLVTLLFFIVAIVAIFALVNNNKNITNNGLNIQNSVQQTNQDLIQESSEIILFYGEGCPHCALVDEYIVQNDVESKVAFTKKEVYHNEQNANDLLVKAKACGLLTDSIGVPFLWDGSKCLIGDQDIIEFFKAKMKE